MITNRLIVALACAAVLLSFPAIAREPSGWQVRFTPGQDCTGLIVTQIGEA